jgi:arginine decarboxylase-like protein
VKSTGDAIGCGTAASTRSRSTSSSRWSRRSHAFGRRYHHGLEAGSKAELIAALAYMHDPEALIVCNGYKDEEFIDLALYAPEDGPADDLVLEMPSELD